MNIPNWVIEHIRGLDDGFTGDILWSCNEGGVTSIRVGERITEEKCEKVLTKEK